MNPHSCSSPGVPVPRRGKSGLSSLSIEWRQALLKWSCSSLAVIIIGAVAPPSVGLAETRGWCGGERATIVGTDGDDKLTGTANRDVIVALGGRDQVEARGGDDIVCAGPGPDTVRAGAGADSVFAGRGADLQYGARARTCSGPRGDTTPPMGTTSTGPRGTTSSLGGPQASTSGPAPGTTACAAERERRAPAAPTT